MSDANKSEKRKQWLCWCGALLPFALGIIFHAVGPLAQAAPSKRELPGLSFAQYMVDEGTPEVRPYYFARFAFKNTSAETIEVTDLKPSCGCLNPKLEQRVYEPGAMGEFFLRVDPTKEKPGQREYFVDVTYRDPEPREARLTYKLTLPERKIDITPKAVVFYQYSDSGRETSQEVVISDYRSRHFNVARIDSTSPLIRARLKSVERDESDNQHLYLEVTVAGKVPPGTSRAIVNVQTDDELFKVLQIPILISGPKPKVSAENLPIKIEPKALFLRTPSTGPVETSVTIHDYQERPMELTGLSLEAIEGTVTPGTVAHSPAEPFVRQQRLTLNLIVPEGTDEAKGILVIETNSALQPRIEIPLVIEVKAPENESNRPTTTP